MMFKMTAKGRVSSVEGLEDGLGKEHEAYSRQRVGLRQFQDEVRI